MESILYQLIGGFPISSKVLYIQTVVVWDFFHQVKETLGASNQLFLGAVFVVHYEFEFFIQWLRDVWPIKRIRKPAKRIHLPL